MANAHSLQAVHFSDNDLSENAIERIKMNFKIIMPKASMEKESLFTKSNDTVNNCDQQSQENNYWLPDNNNQQRTGE